jgi:O-antigen/teichoic acid export membrane protein
MSTTHRGVALGTALRVINLVATAFVSLLMMPFVVRVLGDRMYGIWILVGTFVGYYGLVDLGLSSAVSRYLSRAVGAADHEQCNRVYNTSLRIFSVVGLAVFALAAIFAALAPMFCKTPEDASVFWKLILILGISLALDFPTRVFTGLLQAHLHFDLLAAFELLSLALRTGLILAVLLAGHQVVALGWVTLLSGIPAEVLLVYFAYKSNPFLRLESRYWGMDTARSLFSYSVSSFVARMADLLRFQVDGPVVAAFVGLGAVTHYKIAGTLAQYFLALMLAGTQAFPSVFSRQEGARDFEGMKRTFFFTTKISVSAASFIGFGLIAWGKPFILRWMGPQYLDAYPCLVVLVAGHVCGLSQAPSVQLLYGISKHKFFAWFNSIEGVANLLLSLLLVKRYGMVGVALGTMIPMVITKLLIQPVYVCRVAEIDYFEYVRGMGRSLAVIAGCLLIPFLLSARFATPDYKALFVVGLLSMISYGLALWFFEFTPTETRMLERAISPRLAPRTGAN